MRTSYGFVLMAGVVGVIVGFCVGNPSGDG